MASPFSNSNRRVNGSYVSAEVTLEESILQASQAVAGYSGRVAALTYRPLKVAEVPTITHDPYVYVGTTLAAIVGFGATRARVVLALKGESFIAHDYAGGSLRLTFWPDDITEERTISTDGLISCDEDGTSNESGLYWCVDVSEAFGSYGESSITGYLLTQRFVLTESEPGEWQARIDYRNGRVQLSSDWAADETHVFTSYYWADQPIRAEHFDNGAALSGYGTTYANHVPILNSLGRISKWFIKEAHDITATGTVSAPVMAAEELSADEATLPDVTLTAVRGESTHYDAETFIGGVLFGNLDHAYTQVTKTYARIRQAASGAVATSKNLLVDSYVLGTLDVSAAFSAASADVAGAIGSATATLTAASASISGAIGSATATLQAASASISGAIGSATATLQAASASISGALGIGGKITSQLDGTNHVALEVLRDTGASTETTMTLSDYGDWYGRRATASDYVAAPTVMASGSTNPLGVYSSGSFVAGFENNSGDFTAAAITADSLETSGDIETTAGNLVASGTGHYAKADEGRFEKVWVAFDGLANPPVIIAGADDPTASGGIAAYIGSLYLRQNGGTTGELWVKTGTLNDAWTKAV